MQSGYSEQVDKISERLHRLADDVKREGKARNSTYDIGGLGHITAAQRVLHEVTWGIANLNLNGLLSWAMEADLEKKGELE